MEDVSAIALVLIICNCIFSYYGFKESHIFDSYKFNVDSILIDKEYKRIITSGFLHGSWTHLAFNMISLYAFSESLEQFVGPVKYLAIYFASLIGGGLFALFVRRNDGDYSSIGASGAVCGIVFSSIALFPGMEIGMLGLPLSIPAWLYAIAYVLYTIYGIKAANDNIGHEAHFGGLLIGVIATLLFYPNAIYYNYVSIMLIIIPAVIFIFIVLTKPYLLHVDTLAVSGGKMTIDEKYNHDKKIKQDEIDRILDKINRKGYGKLTQREKVTLNEFEQR